MAAKIKFEKPVRGEAGSEFYFTSMRIPFDTAKKISLVAKDNQISYSQAVIQMCDHVLGQIDIPRGKVDIKPSVGATKEYAAKYTKAKTKKATKPVKAKKAKKAKSVSKKVVAIAAKIKAKAAKAAAKASEPVESESEDDGLLIEESA